MTLLALIAGLYAVGSFLQWLSARAGKLVAFRTTNAIVRDAFAKLGRLPLSFFDTHKHGDVIHTLTNDADMVAEGLSQGIIQFISGVLSIVISLVMMLMLDVRVTLVAVFVTPLCFFVGWAITRYGSRRFRAQAGTLGELNGFAEAGSYTHLASATRVAEVLCVETSIVGGSLTSVSYTHLDVYKRQG